jgi:hypothetical protein
MGADNFTVPLLILVVLAVAVLMSARLAKDTKYRREGFTDVMTEHENIIQLGQERYNPLMNLINVFQNPFVGADPKPAEIDGARQDIRGSLAGPEAGYKTGTTPVVLTGPGSDMPYKIPSDTRGMRTYNIQKCEAVKTDDCSAFEDRTFAENCGMCHKVGTDSSSAGHRGGLFFDHTNADGAEHAAQAMGEMRPNYSPTIGSCPPGYFTINKAGCERQKRKQECEEKKTFNLPGCSQCYTNGNFTLVDNDVTKADPVLMIQFIGRLSVMVPGNTEAVFSKVSNSLSDITFTLPGVNEGATVILNVEGVESGSGPGSRPAPPSLGGFIQGTTVTGVFRLDIGQLADTDLKMGTKPRFIGEITVGGDPAILIGPARGQNAMSLRVNIPLTFVDVREEAAQECTGGPYLTKESSAALLKSGTCFGGGQGVGNYSMACLQEKFTELGGTTNGTAYPRDAATLAALNKDSTGRGRQLGEIAGIIYDKAVEATTGVSVAGRTLALPQWNDASMFALGIQVTSPCDAVQITGTMTNECLKDLWQNKGAGKRTGATYTSPISRTSLTGSKDQFCTSGGLLSPYAPDGTLHQEAITRANAAGGSIGDVKKLYDLTHKRANDNSLSDNDRRSAIEDCYGIGLNMATPAAPAATLTDDALMRTKRQLDEIYQNIRYLNGYGLFEGGYNETTNKVGADKTRIETSIAQPVKARYVRVKPSMDAAPYERCIQISQLEVFNKDGVEVAKGKPTSGSSTWQQNSSPANAVDGATAARIFPAMFHDACNTNGMNQFWMVDLQSEQDIAKIVYYNRKDCCGNRADGMPVELLDSSMNVVAIKKIIGSAPVITLNMTKLDTMNVPWPNLA